MNLLTNQFNSQVWELHSLTIVMLNREDEFEPFEAYFPLSGSAEFDNIRVEFMRQEDHRDYSVTILRIYNMEVHCFTYNIYIFRGGGAGGGGGGQVSSVYFSTFLPMRFQN